MRGVHDLMHALEETPAGRVPRTPTNEVGGDCLTRAAMVKYPGYACSLSQRERGHPREMEGLPSPCRLPGRRRTAP